MSDIQEEREYFKECSKRYEKKSKSEQHAKIQTNLSALKKCGKVWEFGHEINFNDPRDQRNYLVYVAEWLASIKLPSDITKFNDFVKRHKKRHRVIVWRILSHGGMKRATCLVKSVDRRLKQTDIDSMDIEAQGSSSLTWWDIIYFVLFGFMQEGWEITTDRWKKLKLWLKSLNVTEATVKLGGSLMTNIKHAGNSVSEGVKNLGIWIKKMVKDMLAYLPSGMEIIWWIAKHFTTILALMAGAVVIGVLAPIIAVPVMRLLFKKYEIQGGDKVLDQMGAKTEAQGWTPGIADDFLEMIAVNFKIPTKELSGAVGALPKLASIGKAIEWFLEKGYTIILCLVEFVTGKPLAYDEVEKSILTFVDGVSTFKALVQAGDMLIALAPDTLARDQALEQQKKSIEVAMNHIASKKPIRPYFSNKMATATLAYASLHVELERTKRSAKPRPVPIWIYISGVAGVGKSNVTTKLMMDIWQLLRKIYPDIVADRPWSYRDVFTINQDEQFYDNYAKEFFAICDDFFQTKDNEERRKIALALIGMISSVPYSLKVATPEQKANCFFESRCIISTTNYTQETMDHCPGIESPDALASRRTISCELEEKGGRPVFRLFNDMDVSILGQKKTYLDYEELVLLAAQCLIHRDKQLKHPYTPVPIPIYPLTFSGGRINFTTAQMKKGAMKEEKGKEKDKIPDYDIYTGRPFTVFSDATCNNIQQLLDQGNSDLSEDFRQKDEDDADEAATAYTKQLEEEYDDIVVQQPESYTEACGGALRDMPYNVFSKGKRNIVTEDGQLCKLKPCWVAYFMRLLESKPIKHEMNYLWPVTVEANNGEKFLAVYVGDGKCTLVKTKEEWKTLTILVSIKTYKCANGYRITDERYAHLPKLFSWMPMWLLKRVMKVSPGYIIPPYTIRYVPEANFSWQKVRDSWLGSLGETESEIQKFQELFEVEGMMPATPREFNEFFQKVHRTKCDWATIATVVAGSAIFFAGLGLVCSLLMPQVLYKEEAQMYPGSTARTATMKIHRANRGRNANRLTNVKAAARVAATTAQMKTRDYSPIYAKIDRNTEIFECLVTPKGATKEEVDSAEVLTSSFGLFFGGTRALVPMHTMIALGPVGEEYTRWIRLVRNQNYTVDIKDLEIEEIRGDVAVVDFPGLQMKQNLIHHFARDPPTHGTVDHINPFIDYPTFSVTNTAQYSNKITTVKITGYESFEADMEFGQVPNYKGMCGTAYCSNVTGQIFAIHMAGNRHTSTSHGVTILRSDLEKYAPDYETIVDPITAEMTTGTMKPGLQVLGVTEAKHGTYIIGDTNLRQSDFDMTDFPFPVTDSEPAMLRPVDGVSPATNAFEKIGQQYYHGKPKLIDTDLLEFAPQTYNRHNVRQLTPFEAIHGVPGLIPSLDKRTGVGYFYKKMGFTRKTLFYDKEGKPFVHPLLYCSVMNKLQSIREKKLIVPVFEDTLKDELRDGERVRLGKTRLFTAGDLDFLVIQRMVLGTLIVELEGDPVGGPCALGLNPHSVDWGQLFARLGGKAEILNKILAGDFNGYDISVKNEALDAFVKMCLLLTIGLIDPYLVEWVIRATFLGWHVYGRTWYLRPWGTNSGSYITSLFNSFVNWWLHKQAFLALYPQGQFRDVPCSFTGDDSVVGVEEKYAAYDMTYLARYFKDTFGMTYTSCFKDDRRSLEIGEIQYLKRRFVDGEIGIMAPLEERSMYDMVAWVNKDPNRDIIQSILDSLLLEGFHYGEKKYNQLYVWASKQQLLGGNYKLMSYADMRVMRRADYV